LTAAELVRELVARGCRVVAKGEAAFAVRVPDAGAAEWVRGLAPLLRDQRAEVLAELQRTPGAGGGPGPFPCDGKRCDLCSPLRFVPDDFDGLRRFLGCHWGQSS
jgi:hypothetical protein